LSVVVVGIIAGIAIALVGAGVRYSPFLLLDV